MIKTIGNWYMMRPTDQPRHLLNPRRTVKDHQVVFIDLYPQGLMQQTGHCH